MVSHSSFTVLLFSSASVIKSSLVIPESPPLIISESPLPWETDKQTNKQTKYMGLRQDKTNAYSETSAQAGSDALTTFLAIE